MLHNPTYNNLGTKALQFKQQTRGQRQWIRFSNSGTWEHYFPVFMQNRANLISDNKITRHRMSSLYVRSQFTLCKLSIRAVGRSENQGVPVLFGGHNLPPMVEIGLTDLPKSGSATQKTKITEKVHKPLLGL